MLFKPVTSEKAVRMIEGENTLLFKLGRTATRDEIKKNFEEMFKVKVERVRTLMRGNDKYVFIKLKKDNPAIDIATKLGMI